MGDALRAMVVCRAGRESGDLIYRTWKQLEQAFDIREDHGRLKNNYATAGILEGPKHQKPPDMLMNAVLDVDGAMSMHTGHARRAQEAQAAVSSGHRAKRTPLLDSASSPQR